jgi:alpha-2-macroglobulin
VALVYYKQVADRFGDAADAVETLTHKDLKLPEASVVHPEFKPREPKGGGLRAIAVQKAEPPAAKQKVVLKYRNIAEADVKVYPVDLMRLYLARRSLDEIARIDLAGIRPRVESQMKLGSGSDFEEKSKDLDLPMQEEGAYLVIVRGESLFTSGIVLVTPLEMEVMEWADSGRVRVTVRDAQTKAGVARVQVKATGSGNDRFFSGQTDLRGVFVAEGIRGQVTAVARQGEKRYAFYRGLTRLGKPQAPAERLNDLGRSQSSSLHENLKNLNRANQGRQIDRLEKRFQGMGGMGGMMGGGFR